MASEAADDDRAEAPTAAAANIHQDAQPPRDADAADADAAAPAAPRVLSKKAQKRLAKAARVAEFRAARKEQRRDEKREAREAAQRAKRQKWAEEDAAKGGDGDGATARSESARLAHERRLEQARARAARRAAATAPGAQRIAVDLRWADGRMSHSERRSLAQQLSFAYSASLGGGGGSGAAAGAGAAASREEEPPPPLHLHLLGAGGLLRAQMESQLVGLGRWAATVVHDDGLLQSPPNAEQEGKGQGGGEEEAATTATTPAAPPKPFDDDGDDAGAVPIAEFFARRGVPASDLVYLSADSPHELEGDDDDDDEGGGKGEVGNDDNANATTTTKRGLDPSKVYIVGGIVDRNRLKGACLRRAEAAGMSHARLPIEKHLMAAAAAEGGGNGGSNVGQRRLAGSRVLTVNQVVELLARRAAGDTWARALAVVIPARKTEEVRAVTDGKAAKADDEKKKDDADATTQ